MPSFEISCGAAVWMERIATLLLLASVGRRDVGVQGLAIKETYYVDGSCEVEMSHTLQFGLIAVDAVEDLTLGEMCCSHLRRSHMKNEKHLLFVQTFTIAVVRMHGRQVLRSTVRTTVGSQSSGSQYLHPARL